MKIFSRIVLIGFAGLATSGVAQAQISTNNLANANTGQNLVGASVGNGLKQTAPIVSANSQGRPAVGVGALSGNPDHYGTSASVSVANSDRLLGVDGPGGANSGISIKNPRGAGAPVLSQRGK